MFNQHGVEVLISAVVQEKDKVIITEREETKLLSFTNDMIIYVENLKLCINYLIRELRKIVAYKNQCINIDISIFQEKLK